MSCKIIVVDGFKRDAKRLIKKYNSLKVELAVLQEQLLQNPRIGVLIHENTYKIRLAVKSKGKGKSGGMRIITHVIDLDVQLVEDINEQNTTVFLLTIYDKSEMENISDRDLHFLLDEIQNELDQENDENE